MAASEAFIVQGEDPPTTASPVAMASGPIAASPRWPQLIPVAQLLAIILGVLGIIWHQQQTTDSLRNELRADIDGVRIKVSENGQRLARIEGFLGIGIPDAAR